MNKLKEKKTKILFWTILVLIWLATIGTVFLISKYFSNIPIFMPMEGKSDTGIINGFSEQIHGFGDYTLNVGTVPERDRDLDFWLMVTAPPTSQELIDEEELGDWELLSQLVQAEAGNQDLTGMRLVADVVLNRVDSPQFPNTISEVIFQKGQFEVTWNGMFEKAAWEISDNAFKAVEMEMSIGRMDSGILYFSTYPANGKGFWKYGGHWFSY